MKKVFLLLAGGLVGVAAHAQYMKNNGGVRVHNEKSPMVNEHATERANPSAHSGARTTTTDFVTEDFGTGGPGTLPSGWSAGAFAGGTWKWTNHASTSVFALDAMASTTASNGWMIFDSDSIGAACSCAPSGWLQSPPYNCATKPHVRLNFEDYYRKFQDSCFVWVSTSSTFTTYTSYPVLANNELETNISTDNPTKVHINISATAGGQSAVYLRFVTFGPDLGAYSWMIDDLSLSDIDSVDAALRKPSIIYFAAGNGSQYSFGSMPSKMMDTVVPVTYVVNNGFTSLAALPVSAKIAQGTSTVFTGTVNVTAPVNAYDTLADFSGSTPGYYYSNTKASYTATFSTLPGADAVTADNYDTTSYNVTDSTLSENVPGATAVTSGYVYRPGTAYSFSPATKFIVPAGQYDTLTTVSIAFGRNTKPGQVVGAQIYHFDGTNWVYDGLTEFRALTSAEISTAGTIKYATFAVDEALTGGKIVLSGGTDGINYAAVVKGSSNTDTVTVLESDNPAPNAIVGYTGLADTSLNDGASGQEFGQGHLPYANATTPFINLNFGIVHYDKSGVTNVNGSNFVGKAYPNPANTSVSIPYSLNQDGTMTATLTNVTGQTVASQSVSNKAGQAGRVTFQTGALPNGVYLYSIEMNGQRTNGRVVVAH